MDETQPFNDGATAWMMLCNCRLYPPKVFFPSDGVGVRAARRGLPVTDANDAAVRRDRPQLVVAQVPCVRARASNAGVRENTGKMPVASSARSVTAARYPHRLTASNP